jgi:ubiquinol-cytochrome c reductase iron-sulfur subunit
MNRRGNVRAKRAAMVAFLVAALGGATAAISDLLGVDAFPSLSGIGLALALLGTGFGLVAWAKHLGFDELAVEEREPLAMTDEQRAALGVQLEESRHELGRRGLLTGFFVVALGMLGVALIGPIGSLDSQASGDRKRTRWRSGVRLATSDGAPVRADIERFDQLITVFPADALTADDSQVVLVRVRPDLLAQGTVEGGAVDGWVAYSKICTHAGCAVALYRTPLFEPTTDRPALVCPCHYSTFDPAAGGTVLFGPAGRPLPQLPLLVGSGGELAAGGTFSGPVGPSWWGVRLWDPREPRT